MSSMLEALAGLLLVFALFLIMLGFARLEEHLKKPKDDKKRKEEDDGEEHNTSTRR